jgi:16S rRNA (cytidine1402-2'-O)-methyltransferase
MNGTLYVVATPIGNLEDITLRAVSTLKNVDVIACENRERHIKLLNHLGIKKHIIEYSPANERNSAKGIIKLLMEGKNIALASDAGVPAVSDPGKILVEEARKEGIKIIPVPGPSALTTLISVSGMSAESVVFLGFLSKSPGKQAKELLKYKNIETVIVLFVSQYRIKNILSIINKTLGNVEIIIGREMTKINEEFISGRVSELIDREFMEKGEFTVAVLNRL